MTLVESLETRWMVFAKSLKAEPRMADEAFMTLLGAYDAPSRQYHSLTHIHACLNVMDKYVPLSRETPHIEMALWWHDLVYVPQRGDNEEKSAFDMLSWGRRMGLNERFLCEVADMIPYTKHKASLVGMADRYKYMLDVDLSILGESEEIFDAYEDGIRFEYSVVPLELFRAGRAKVLQSFLDRPFIYETDRFRAVFEAQARVNLARSIAKLTA